MNESNIQQNTDKPGDEIDIFEFSSRIWAAFIKFLINVKDLIVSIIIFLIRKSLWIVTFAVIGMILGYVFCNLSKISYVSSIEGDTGGVNNSTGIDHINKLYLLRSKPLLLAKQLGMSEEQTKAINYIKACYGIDVNRDGKPDYVDYKDTYNPKDTTQRRIPSFVHIRISVFDESILPVLRKNLLQYIENNAYVQVLHKIDREQKEALITELDKEIAKIEELQAARIKKEAATSVEMGRILLQGNEPEPKLFYQDILSLYNQKQSIKRDLEISDEIIVVVHDLTPLGEEERSVLKYVAIFGGLMAVIGLFSALCWQYRKRIWYLIWENSAK